MSEIFQRMGLAEFAHCGDHQDCGTCINREDCGEPAAEMEGQL